MLLSVYEYVAARTPAVISAAEMAKRSSNTGTKRRCLNFSAPKTATKGKLAATKSPHISSTTAMLGQYALSLGNANP